MDLGEGKCTTSSDGNSRVGSQILLNGIEAMAAHHPNKPAVHQLPASENGRFDEAQDIILSYSDIVALVNKICWQLDNGGLNLEVRMLLLIWVIRVRLTSLPSGLRKTVRNVLRLENAKSTRDGYIHENMILIAGKGKLFIRMPRGVIHRNMTLDRYCQDICLCQKLPEERYHPLLGVRILAPGYGSGVVTAEGRRVGSRGVFQLDLENMDIHESIDFCFGNIHTVHLTVYTVPSW